MTNLNAFEERPPVIPVRPWSFALWFLLPAWALLWFASNPPHAVDMALARPFFSDGAWPWHASAALETWFHFAPKVLSILFGVGVAAAAVYAWGAARRARDRGNALEVRLWRERFTRLVALVGASLLCVTAVWWLKASTGVACPWSLEDFGGRLAFSAPDWPFFRREGACWPSGAAGSGFCLLPAYFMFRDDRPRLARVLLAVAIVLGCVAGFARMMAGAHFLSHVVSAFLVDWLIAAAVYVLVLDRAAFGRWASCAREAARGMSLTTLALLTGLFWAAFLDAPLLARLLIRDGSASAASITLTLAACAAFTLVGAGLVQLLGILPRRLFIIILAMLNIASALSFCATHLYGIAMTPDMARNFIATDPAEASGYLSLRSAWVFLMAALPPLALQWVWARGAAQAASAAASLEFGRPSSRLTGVGLALLLTILGVAVLATQLRGFSGAMRSDKSLRYMIAPVSVLWSVGVTLAKDETPGARAERTVVDPTPKLEAKVSRPTLLVVVVGETARAQNWGLSGYGRDTTPELAKVKGLINFREVRACGTSTDVSLPCMMSRIGRSDYSRKRILSEEQLPKVLARAGVNVLWIDNQSGCKGACEGVPSRRAVADADMKRLCPTGDCTDEVLLPALEAELGSIPADRPTVVFLHMIGSHGPAYSQRSPEERKPFGPECTEADLGGCSRESVVNAYDNSIRETDRVLAGLIGELEAKSGAVDSALLYLSDHGESLGEGGVYLHGAPWWIAPSEQTRVPMVFWLSEGYEKAMGVNRAAFEAHAGREADQEHLWSTVLHLAGVSSLTRRDAFDLGVMPQEK